MTLIGPVAAADGIANVWSPLLTTVGRTGRLATPHGAALFFCG